ncbi:hypothetical protein BGX28_002397 [Mortierella sp. GBA30]|nr:hypothetical protein BGX28_002397 [Mortierella sp. GBA30]
MKEASTLSQDESVPPREQEYFTPMQHVSKYGIQHYLNERIERIRSSEWHEALSPRLFIVIPFDDIKDKARKMYKLYWLCEHLGNDRALLPHLHDFGFELNHTDELFKNYREALFIGLQLFRATKGYVVDEGNEFSYTQGINFLIREFKALSDKVMTTRDVEAILDDMISFSRPNGLIPIAPSALQEKTRNDFYEIRSFLVRPSYASKRSMDDYHSLFRSVGDEGYVQWICSNHFTRPRSGFDPNRLQTAIHKYGVYDDQRGLITAELCSEKLTSGLKFTYEQLDVKKYKCVSELRLCLVPNATGTDLGRLYSSVADLDLVGVALTSEDFDWGQPTLSLPIKHIFKYRRIQYFGMGNVHESQRHINPLLLTKRSARHKAIWLALDPKTWNSSTAESDFRSAIGGHPPVMNLHVCDTLDSLQNMPDLESSFWSLAAKVHERHTVTFLGQDLTIQ